MSILEKLSKINFNTASPDTIRNILNNYSADIRCIKCKIDKGIIILRARKGFFYNREEMTYCPKEKCTSTQRASLPGETLFYGVISDDSQHLENARAIATSECSVLCRDGINSIGREMFTISYWKTMAPLNVVSFITNKSFPKVHDNYLLNKLKYVFDDYFKYDDITSKDLIYFISSEFSKSTKSNSEYLISATITSDIINNNINIDGIVYPPVQLNGQGGLNIALTPNAVNKKLHFYQTVRQPLYKNKNRLIQIIESCTNERMFTYMEPHFPHIKNIIEKTLNIQDISLLPWIY